MGNSTGIIVPRAILGEIGLAIGAEIDLRVENGKLIGTPIASGARVGWAEAAAIVAEHETDDEIAWRAFGNEDDGDLTW